METAARLSALHAAPPLLAELGLLADATRGRMLACLDGIEMTVVELCESLALPQSTVSRHLKQLADAGWVDARRDGTSRRYALTVDRLDEPSRRLWGLVRESLAESVAVRLDLRRREQVLARRERDTRAFFSDVADEWDRLRAELFGATTDLQLLPALLDPDVAVGDLGCGSGRLAATIAPYARSVVAVDASPEMLDVARSRLAGFANVDVVEGRIEDLPLASGSLDLALVVHLLHHVADPSAALAEVARVLRPGGRVVIADVLPHPYEEYRRTMGHVWLGFGRPAIEAEFAQAGLAGERWHEAGVEPGARGPAMFVATAVRPRAPQSKKTTTNRREP
jgi:ubiquinone/menaquinone biosynthesis C-methylase UbiE/DNA-binding MarR family transcriptional regulator